MRGNTFIKAFGLVTLFLLFSRFSDDPSSLVNGTVPSFTVMATDSTVIDKDFFHSKATIINFYSWACIPCRQEIGMLIKLASEFDVTEISILIITTDNPKKILKHFSDKNDGDNAAKKFAIEANKIKIVSDADRALYSKFHVRPTPATFFIDDKGIIREYFLGFPDHQDDADLLYRAFKEKVQNILFRR